MNKQTSTDQFVDRQLIDIPDDLRKLDRDHVENIKVSIAAKGQIIPVVLEQKEGGRFWLRDGQHRLAACDELKKQKIKFVLTDDPTAGDIANLVRKNFTLAERIEVVTSSGSATTDSALATTLGVTTRKVKQYRALATLPKVVITSVDNGLITEQVAQSATLMPKAMLKDLENDLVRGEIPYWCSDPSEIRQNIEELRVPVSAAVFDVPASKLEIEQNLFDEEDGFFANKKAFLQHQARAVGMIAKALDPKAIVGMPGKRPNEWHNQSELRAKFDVGPILFPGAAAQRTNLLAEAVAIKKKIAAKKDKYDGDLTDENNRLLEDIGDLERDPRSYDPSKFPSGARVMAYVSNTGEAKFLICAPVKSAPAAKSGPKLAAKRDTAPKAPLTAHNKKSWRIARDHRSLQVQAAIVADPQFGLRLLLAGAISDGLFGVSIRRERIQSDVPSHIEAVKKIQGDAKRETIFEKVWERVSVLPLEGVVKELARVSAPAASMIGWGVDKMTEDKDDKAWKTAYAVALSIVPATPLPLEYFTSHQSAQLLKLIKQMKGAKTAALYEGKPKMKIAEAARSFAIETGWLPSVLETSAAANTKKTKASRKKAG